MHRLTIAKRALLGYRLNNILEIANKNYIEGKSYYNLTTSDNKLNGDHLKFHNKNFLIGVSTFLESYISDTLKEILISFPGKLESKNIKLESLANHGSTIGVITEMAEKYLNELNYKSFQDIIKICSKILQFDTNLDQELIGKITELKATRDIIIHNKGIVNETYLRKSAYHARGRDGDEILISADYLKDGVDLMIEFCDEFHKAIPDKIKSYDRKKAFREMWEMSGLNSVVNFDSAWVEDPNNDIVRPKKNFSWAWSSSEEELFKFFMFIYNSDDSNFDFFYLLKRWPPKSSSGQVILSWLDSPFHF